MDMDSDDDSSGEYMHPFDVLFSSNDDGTEIRWPKLTSVSPFETNRILLVGDAFLAAAKADSATRIHTLTLALLSPPSGYFGNGVFGRKHEEIYYELMEMLAQGLGYLRGLKTIVILGPASNYLDIDLVNTMLTKIPQIEALELNWKDPGGLYTVKIAKALKNGLPNLKNLVLREGNLGKLVFPGIQDKKISSISCLDNGGYTLSDAAVGVFGCSSLTELVLERCYLAECQCQRMASYLGNKESNLESLKLLKIGVEGEGAALILGALKKHNKIKELQLGPAMLKEGGCETLGELLEVNHSLERVFLLGLGQKKIGDSKPAIDPSVLSSFFNKAKANLGSLCIDGVGFWTEQLTEEFGAWLALDTVTVEGLHLKGTTTGYFPLLANWTRMVDSVAGNNGLQRLNLDFDIDQRQAVELASALQNNSCLKMLYLSLCGSQANATQYTHTLFLQALGRNATLQSLLLRSDVKLRPDKKVIYRKDKLRKQHLAALAQNYGIRLLAAGPFHHSGLRFNVLKMNGAGRKYVMTDPTNKALGIKVLQTVIHELNGIFFHLLENPALCDNISDGQQSKQTKGKRALETQNQRANKRRGKRGRPKREE